MSTNLQPASKPHHASPAMTREADVCGKKFSFWYFEGLAGREEFIHLPEEHWIAPSVQVVEPFSMFGNDLPMLWSRFEQMEEFERETLNDLRNHGASIPDVVDYIRAEHGFNAEDKRTRTEVATSIRRKQFLETSTRIEATGRKAALMAGAVGLVAMAGIAIVSGAVEGVALAPWLPDAIEMTKDLMQSAAGGGALLVAWKTWQEINELKFGHPKLDLGKKEDFKDLPNSLGNPDYNELNHQHQSIPRADQHLVKHMSPTELRAFLLGGDATRLHVLTASPPSAYQIAQSQFDPVVQSRDSKLTNLVKLCKTLLSSPLQFSNHTVPKLRERLEAWRQFANTQEQLEEAQDLNAQRAARATPNTP